MEGAAVKLIIKAPNQQIKDQVVQCDVRWTIGRLKEHLSEVYPNKPASKNQKLIYSGQLLTDSSCLKDVLRPSDGQEDQSYTVHLVCAPQKTNINKLTPEKKEPAETSSTDQSMPNNIETTRLNTTNNVQTQSIDNSNVSVQHTPAAQLFSTQYFDPHNSQQVAWMQQAYTHYFTQYMQLMAAQGIQLQTSIPYIQQMNINSNDTAQNPYINNINNTNDEQSQPATQDTPEANAEDNDGAGEDGAFNQDWIDVFYMFSKILLLFTIVYFYSSPLKFLIVTLLGFVIYLYQGGFIRVQPVVPENNNPVENNNQVLQNEGNNGARGAVAQQNDQTPAGQSEGRTNANEEPEEERPGRLELTWTFLSTLITSLIPDEPNI